MRYIYILKSKSDREEGGGESYSHHKEPVECISPPLIQIRFFGPQC